MPKLQGRVRKIQTTEYGERLIFEKSAINPRNELGKIGVTFHSSFGRLFRGTINVEATVVDERGNETTETLYINRSSLRQYVQATDKATDMSAFTDEQLIGRFNAQLWKLDNLNNPADKNAADKQGDAGNALRHAGQHNQRRIDSWSVAIQDSVRGSFFSWLYQKTISAYKWLKIRFLFVNSEQDYVDVSEVLAKKRFKEAAEDVPAYRQHLASNAAFQHKEDKTFADIPETTKDNYVKPHSLDDWNLHHTGHYPTGSKKTDTSTGTSGKPTEWVRGSEELETVKKSLRVAAEIEFGERNLEYINAFAFGPWATGLTTYEVMRKTGSIFATGPDKDKILEKLENIYRYEEHLIDEKVVALAAKHPRLQRNKANQAALHQCIRVILDRVLDDKNADVSQLVNEAARTEPLIARYRSELVDIITNLNKSRSQIILAGYPPFLKDLVDYAKVKGIDFKKYHVRGIVGGQAISETLRSQLVEGGFVQVNSSYGASDLDINVGVETDYEAKVRKAMEENPGLRRELCGNNQSLPMVFHGDPMNYFIECADNNDLLFTCTRSDRSSPRVRYNLGDKGRIHAASDVQAALNKYGIFNIQARTNLPLIFIWGRESTIVYGGANVAYTDAEKAVKDCDSANVCLKMALHSYEDRSGKEQFRIFIELKEGIEIPSDANAQEFIHQVLIRMSALNQDFRWQLENLGDGLTLPKVVFFTRKNSPISEADGHRKQVLVFKDEDLKKAGFEIPADESKAKEFSINIDAAFKEEMKQAVHAPKSRVLGAPPAAH